MNTLTRVSSWLVAGAIVAAVPAAALAADNPLPGKTAISKRDKNTNAAKLAKFTAKAPKGGPYFFVPAPLSVDDPTIAGGTLTIFKTSPGVYPPIALPAGSWQGLGNPAGSKGYKYRGAGSGSDPCKSVIVKPKVIKATCKGPTALSPSFTIPVGAASVSHSLVLGGTRYCTLFPPPFTKDDGAKKIWKDKNASAPGSCPNPVAPTPTPPPATPTPPPATPTPTPPPATPTPTPPPYGSASQAFLQSPASLLN